MSPVAGIRENETRQRHIDADLARAGWGTAQRNLVTEYALEANQQDPPYHGREYCDYVLLGSDGKPLAVVEAKRTSRDELSGKRQAADYADRIKARFGFDPFIFLTNGQTIQFWDRERYPPRQVSGFYSRDDLERLAHQRRHALPLASVEIDDKIAGRPYQVEAIRRVSEGIEAAHRKFLVIMATGAGKTRTVIALTDLLVRARRIQRVLFLADRRELVKQAVSEFKSHLPNEQIARIENGEVSSGARIHIATYPGMMQLFQTMSAGHYDLIIADESHRSIYNRYRAIFEHFDCLQLGLTATPTDFIDHNTFGLFGCEDGVPTFHYGLEQAVADNHLVTYRVLQSQTRFQLSGIKSGQISEELKAGLAAAGIDPEELAFEGTDIERKVTNRPTNEAIVREFMDRCRKDTMGLPEKTIVFAVSHEHAKRLMQAFDRLYPDLQRQGLAELIDSHMERAEEWLDDFKYRDMPRVAISIDMLDTGIDVPAIQNLVFAKPILSYVKFWQMIGRGTRRYRNPITGEEKPDFLIIDCWNNFGYFGLAIEGEVDHPTEPLPVRLFRLRLEKRLLLRGRGEDATTVTAHLQAMLANLPKDNVNIRPHREEIAKLIATWPDGRPESERHLSQTIAPLLRYYGAESQDAIQFRVLVERASVAFLAGQPDELTRRIETIRDNLKALAESVPAVRAVAEQRAFALSAGFWQHLTLVRLDELQAAFAPLMRYRQREKAHVVELDLPDRIASRRWIIYGPTGEGAFAESYREQVEAHVRKLAEALPALQKLKHGESLTDYDLDQIGRALNQADLFITEATLRETYGHPAASLPDFLRHILHLGHLPTWEEAIAEAFEGFIAEHGYMSASQINFLRGVRAAVLRRAKLTPAQLGQPPLARIGNVSKLFEPSEVEEILAFANQLVDKAA